jgi:amino acid transporter
MSKTFVREATGLVREVSFLDYFMTNLNGVTFFYALAVTPWYIWYATAGGDVVLGSIGGLLLNVFGNIVVFAMITSTFPRSGSPYVANSRVLHPALAWPAEVCMWMSQGPLGLGTLAVGLISAALVPGLYTMGVSSGNASLVSAAFALTQPMWMATLGVVVVLGTMAFVIWGVKAIVHSFQLPMTILMIVGAAVLLVYWASANLTNLQAVLPKYTSVSYSAILTYASTNYSSAMVPISYAGIPVMMSILFTVGAYNSYWGSWVAGEVKKASSLRMQYVSMVIPSFLLFGVTVLTVGLAQLAVGRNFLIAMTQILTNNPGFFSSLPSVTSFGTIVLIPMMIADNTIAQFLIMLMMIGAVLATSVYMWLLTTRDFLAFSFDRLLPAKFADVSDRTHTPIFNIVFNALLACVIAVAVAYAGSYISYAFVSMFTLSCVEVGLLMFAAIVIPLRKDIWSISSGSKYKVLGIPLISIAGVLGLVYNWGAAVLYVALPQFGWGPQASEFLIATIGVPFVLYWIIRKVRISQGIDVNAVFRTIPPE